MSRSKPRQSEPNSEPLPASTALVRVRSTIQNRSQKKQRQSLRKPAPSDRRRWFLHVGKGLEIEDIAEREGVAPAKIQDSIDVCKEYRFQNSNESVALAINEQVLKLIPEIGEVFAGGLTAVKHLPQRNGRYKKVEDHAIRLKTVETIKSLQEVAQPKAPLVQNNTQFNNNTGGGGPMYAPGMSFEARLRKLREQRGLSNGDSIVGASENAADADEDQSVADELNDIGVDLEDDEEVEDGELVEEE